MTRNEFENAIQNTTAMPLLGYFVGWGLDGGAANQLTVQGLLEKHSLDDDFKLPGVGVTTAYRRAVMQATRGKRAEKPFETVKIKEDGEAIMHAIVKTETVEDTETYRDSRGELVLRGDLDIDIEFRVGFDKTRRNAKTFPPEDLVSFEDEAMGHPLAETIMRLYTKLAVEYSPNDLRMAFQAALAQWGGFRVIPHGAMWFLPEYAENKILAWKDLMTDLGHSPLVIPVFDSKNSKDQLRVLALNTLDGQLKEVKSEIQKLRDNGARKSTFEARLGHLDDLKAKASLYKGLLGAEIEELTTLIESAQEDVLSTLGEE